jgi:hypothetical protein
MSDLRSRLRARLRQLSSVPLIAAAAFAIGGPVAFATTTIQPTTPVSSSPGTTPLGCWWSNLDGTVNLLAYPSSDIVAVKVGSLSVPFTLNGVGMVQIVVPPLAFGNTELVVLINKQGSSFSGGYLCGVPRPCPIGPDYTGAPCLTTPPTTPQPSTPPTTPWPSTPPTTPQPSTPPTTPQPSTPVVTRVSPNTGIANVGGFTTISGRNLKGVKSVTFGAKRAPWVRYNGGKLIVAVPAQKKGRYPVRVTTVAGTSEITPGAIFTYKSQLR